MGSGFPVCLQKSSTLLSCNSSSSAFNVLVLPNGNSGCVLGSPDGQPTSPASWVRGLGPSLPVCYPLHLGASVRIGTVFRFHAWLRSHRRCFLSGYILLLSKFNSPRFQEWDITIVETLPSVWPSSLWPLGVTSYLVNRFDCFIVFFLSAGKDSQWPPLLRITPASGLLSAVLFISPDHL